MMRGLLCIVVALWLLTASHAPARAEPISLSILTALSIEATATALAVTTFALTAIASTAISIGASYLQKALNKGDAGRETPIGASSGRLQAGGVVPRRFGV